MIKTRVRLKEWGNSVGVIIPKSELKKAHLRVHDEVDIIVGKKENVLKEVFGKLQGIKPRSKKSTARILKEIDEELASKYE